MASSREKSGIVINPQLFPCSSAARMAFKAPFLFSGPGPERSPSARSRQNAAGADGVHVGRHSGGAESAAL